jgi:hypothetical protein
MSNDLKLYEVNSKLVGMTYDIPDEVLFHIKNTLEKFKDHKTVKGYKRANFLVNNPNQPYVNLAMIKSYFDNVNKDEVNPIEYALNGGDVLNVWVQDLIKREKERVEGGKVARTNAGMNNQYRRDSEGDDFSTDLPNNVMDTPDIMFNSALLEDITRIKKLINKI